MELADGPLVRPGTPQGVLTTIAIRVLDPGASETARRGAGAVVRREPGETLCRAADWRFEMVVAADVPIAGLSLVPAGHFGVIGLLAGATQGRISGTPLLFRHHAGAPANGAIGGRPTGRRFRAQ